jgi:hypothetical protein
MMTFKNDDFSFQYARIPLFGETIIPFTTPAFGVKHE